MPFKCVIVNPEQQMLDESVEQVILPAHDGLVGILENRAPLLVKLGIGPLRVDLAGRKSRYFAVDGGVAQMKDNSLTVITESAIASGDINAESARAEYAEAEARQPTDAKTAETRQRQMKHAKVKQDLAGK